MFCSFTSCPHPTVARYWIDTFTELLAMPPTVRTRFCVPVGILRGTCALTWYMPPPYAGARALDNTVTGTPAIKTCGCATVIIWPLLFACTAPKPVQYISMTPPRGAGCCAVLARFPALILLRKFVLASEKIPGATGVTVTVRLAELPEPDCTVSDMAPGTRSNGAMRLICESLTESNCAGSLLNSTLTPASCVGHGMPACEITPPAR